LSGQWSGSDYLAAPTNAARQQGVLTKLQGLLRPCWAWPSFNYRKKFMRCSLFRSVTSRRAGSALSKQHCELQKAKPIRPLPCQRANHETSRLYLRTAAATAATTLLNRFPIGAYGYSPALAALTGAAPRPTRCW
jgi:hypothetical protein